MTTILSSVATAFINIRERTSVTGLARFRALIEAVFDTLNAEAVGVAGRNAWN